MRIHFTFYLYHFITIATSTSSSAIPKPPPHARSNLHRELNLQMRNSVCCANKMRCCNPDSFSKIELRAVLVKCASASCDESSLTRRPNKPGYSTRKHGHGQSEEGEEPLIWNCRKKLLVTIKMAIDGSTATPNKPEYITVDHVFDPVTRKNTRLVTPYVIKIKQQPLMQMYALKFLHTVNSHATEEVYNKHQANYTGCDTVSRRPTCGRITYEGKAVPYSEGFCCSCDGGRNTKRQPETFNQYRGNVVRYSDPAFLLDGVECPRNVRGKDNVNGAEDLVKTARSPGREQRASKSAPQHVTKSLFAANSKKAVQPRAKPMFFELKNSVIPRTDDEVEDEQELTPDSEAKSEVPSEIRTANLGQSNFVAGSSVKVQGRDKPIYFEFKKTLPQSNYEVQDEMERSRYFKAKMDSTMKEFEVVTPKGARSNKLQTLFKPENTPKRQVQSSGCQIRGGQDCADRFTPKGFDSKTYHESAHCLRFSDLWYTVYGLQAPVVDHSVLLKIFERQEDLTGRTTWKEVTKGQTVRVGTTNANYVGDKSNFAVKYRPELGRWDPAAFALNHRSALLLVPESTQNFDLDKYPELKTGPAEYLVVHASQISMDGDQCDLAGVGFEAFAKQPNRCSRPKGTCLSNQPRSLWEHDHKAEKLGKRGCFFLKHYGKLPPTPIRKNATAGDHFLLFEYSRTHSSTIELEIKADFNALLTSQSPTRITEVYVDSTGPSKTLLTIKVTNAGLTSSPFMVRLANCALDAPSGFNGIETKLVLIPPQHQHVFHLEIVLALQVDRFHCSAEALSGKRELLALRRVRIQRSDRCVCTWHCLCACVGPSEGLKCVPMSLEHYHAAGFRGSLPIATFTVRYTFLDDMLSLITYVLLCVFLILLLLGLFKGLAGLACSPQVGVWGLDVVLNLPKPDSGSGNGGDEFRGWSDTKKKKKVRGLGRSAEFCVNVVFFFAYPFNVFVLLLKRCCFPRDPCEGCAVRVRPRTEYYAENGGSHVPNEGEDVEEANGAGLVARGIISRDSDGESVEDPFEGQEEGLGRVSEERTSTEFEGQIRLKSVDEMAEDGSDERFGYLSSTEEEYEGDSTESDMEINIDIDV